MHMFASPPQLGDNGVNERRLVRPVAEYPSRKSAMTTCPIALVVGCKKCPAFSVCPLKGVVGDYRKQEETPTQQQAENEDKK